MKTAGVMLDFYDDPTGTVLRSVFPSQEDLPEIVKTAHILNIAEREVLRDEAYALVMQDEGKVFRKFACVDAGNTLLSLLYFEKNAHLLPEEARKATAAVLLERAAEFDLPVGIKKLAAKSPSRTRDPMNQPLVGDEADWLERTNLGKPITGGVDSGRVGTALSSMHTKMASAPIDVSGKQPETLFETKEASIYALAGQYPLDSYADIRAAVAYFEENWPQMQPPDRHEFAVKTAARAEEIGVEVSERMSRYGSEAYAPDVESHLAQRKANADEKYHEVYDALKEKRASIEPEHFAALLAKADVAAGLNWSWGGAVQDPWYSTFGGVAGSEKTAFGWEGGGYSVDAEKLQDAAASGALQGHFTPDIVKAFTQDPVAIFSSMPDDTKLIMARLADETVKTASFISPAADLAGLGILGVPAAKHLMDRKNKNTPEGRKERSTAKYELAGLGTLAGATIHKEHKELGKGFGKGLRALSKLRR